MVLSLAPFIKEREIQIRKKISNVIVKIDFLPIIHFSHLYMIRPIEEPSEENEDDEDDCDLGGLCIMLIAVICLFVLLVIFLNQRQKSNLWIPDSNTV